MSMNGVKVTNGNGKGAKKTTSKFSGNGTFIRNDTMDFKFNPNVIIPSDVDLEPFRLMWLDILSVFSLARLLPYIPWPMRPCLSGSLDELAPTLKNAKDVFLHLILIISQLTLLIALPVMTVVFWFLPGVVMPIFCGAFLVCTLTVMRLLNGGPTRECLVGLPDGEPVNDENELWFFINGVATGKHWLQSNLNLLAKTFQREIVGIHNPTKGLLFDLIECLIQRDLGYKTRDIRQGRAQLRSALLSPTTKKLVLIAHSQGGIEASQIVDSLLSSLPPTLLSKLEIYTFGNAARHLNNPLLTTHPIKPPSKSSHPPHSPSHSHNPYHLAAPHIISHIEHYTNTHDFVANIGVLKFTSLSERAREGGDCGTGVGDGGFKGTVFRREASGHLLNMHYLDYMFKMKGGRVDEDGNEFMDSLVPGDVWSPEMNGNGPSGREGRRIKDISRLWRYINGREPLG